MKKDLSKIKNIQSGFSIAEVIVVSSLFVLFVTVFVGGVAYLKRGISLSGEKAQAIFLSQEGIEAARSIRDSDFADLKDGTHGLEISNGKWKFVGENDNIDGFKREVIISSVDPDVKEVESVVSWETYFSGSRRVSILTMLSNWRVVSKEAVDSCDAFCQSIDYLSGTCRQNDVRCSVEGEEYEAGGDEFCNQGPQADACCCAS